MAILLNIYKDGEKISNLTEHSIQLINFTGSINRPIKPNINDLIDGVVLEGIFNFDVLVPTSSEDIEISPISELDSVRRLANIAFAPEDERDFYIDLDALVTNSVGDTIDQVSLEDLSIVEYVEDYDNERGHAKFYAVIQRRPEEDLV